MEDNSQIRQIQAFTAINWQSMIEQQNVNKENVIDMIKEYGLEGMFLQKEYDNGKYVYIQSEEIGMSLQIESSLLNCVYLYGNNNKKFKEYKGYVPYLINFQQRNGEIVQFLGEPSQKSGGQLTSISIAYEHLGLEFTFLSKTWQERESQIDFISLFKKTSDPTLKKCGACLKQTKNLCARCNLVYYCSQACQKQHFPAHKDKCKLYSATITQQA